MGATNQMTQPQMDSDENLDNLLADLNLLGDDNDDAVIEKSAQEDEPLVLDGSLEAALSDIALDEEITEQSDDFTDIKEEVAAEEPKSPKVTKKTKGACKSEVKSATTEAKKTTVERKHYANKVDRLSDKLGKDFDSNLVLETADLKLTGNALEDKQAETLASIMGAGKKVQNRQTFILEYVAGKSASLNGVITTALKVLKRDGQITTGIEGNFHKELLAKPYSANAAKAMGGNSLLAMRTLKMINVGEGGKFIANPNSIIMEKLAKLGAF
jgi:hypothetical protein